jgi:release factor glutamine methyltransferase
MNANLRLKGLVNNNTVIADWIFQATKSLTACKTPSPRLDTEVLLAHVLRKSRTWLHAHDDAVLSRAQLEAANACTQLRADNVPVAYIIGHKEFYGRQFLVTPATLIPRPESEAIIDVIRPLLSDHQRLLDVGTGSGCLGITAKLEHPKLSVTLSDIDQSALDVAQENASRLSADVSVICSDLLSDVLGTYDIIVANLPYVDPAWETSPDIAHEPPLALFADDRGLAVIKRLIMDAAHHQAPKGYLILEADPCQHDEIISFGMERGYGHRVTRDYIIALERI